MSLTGRLSATGRKTIHERLVTGVGGYLYNMVQAPHVTCAVCATPIKPAFDLCLRCCRDRNEFRVAAACARVTATRQSPAFSCTEGEAS